MEETLMNLAPALVQVESQTATEIVRQVMIYKYIELIGNFLFAIILLIGVFFLFRFMIKNW